MPKEARLLYYILPWKTIKERGKKYVRRIR
uniref:Uncharacterized protein n=1 Tax=Siphoviridae sp. ct4Z13 TaxID=2827778 RepID=A0A8S5SB28_9CAUD|nr:MAG TPA: hypothetical protein [Siphoviridae sp. ct4Z13]